MSLRYGGGATGFRRAEADTWVRVPAMAVGGMLRITIAENRSTLVRKDTVVFTPTGGEGEAKNDSLFISQQAAVLSPILMVRTEPTTLNALSADGGSIETRIVLGGSATGWSVLKLSDAADFVSLVPTRGTGNGMFRLNYAPNTEDSPRQAQIEVRTTGTGEVGRHRLALTQLPANSPLFFVDNKPFSSIIVVNPTKNSLELRGLEVEATVHLFTLSGRLVMSRHLGIGNHTLPLHDLMSSTYLLVLIDEYGTSYRRVLLKK